MTMQRFRYGTYLIVTATVFAGLVWPRDAGALSCKKPFPTCPLPTISNPNVVSITCGDLNNASFTFASNKYYKLSDTSCVLTRTLVLDQPNVMLGTGDKTADGANGSLYALKPNTNMQDAVIRISASNVRLQNIKVEKSGSKVFNDGIVVQSGSDVTLQRVEVAGATSSAGIKISPAASVCARNSMVTNVGSNGFAIDGTGSGGVVDFRDCAALSNTGHGFAVVSSGLSALTFLATSAQNNDIDGYHLRGNVNIYCSDATANTGDGVEIETANTLHMENMLIPGNTGRGVLAVGGATQVIAATLVNNSSSGLQIRGSDLRIVNTIGQGATFVDTDMDPICSANLYSGTNGGCTGTPGTPSFVSAGVDYHLAVGSAGLDAGIDPTTVADVGTVAVAKTQDKEGRSRPSGGARDIGAFESLVAAPTATVTRTRTATNTPLPVATKTSTATRTATPTATPGPCGEFCHGDCSGNCVVSIDELITGVAMGQLNSLTGQSCSSKYDEPTPNGQVSIDEIIRAVLNALSGCSSGGSLMALRAGDPGTFDAEAHGLRKVDAPTVQIVVGSTKGNRGSTATLAISISGTQGEASSLEFDLAYPSDVLGTLSCTLSPTITSKHQVETAVLESGRVRIRVEDGTFPGAALPDSDIVTCQADILPDAQQGKSAVKAVRASVWDAYRKPQPLLVENGSVKVLGGGG